MKPSTWSILPRWMTAFTVRARPRRAVVVGKLHLRVVRALSAPQPCRRTRHRRPAARVAHGRARHRRGSAGPCQRATDPRGDQVAVEPGRGAFRCDLDDVLPRRRFASGEMNVQDAECRRFVEHAQHRRRVHFGGALVEFERVRAVGAMERTAVRQLHQDADGVWNGQARTSSCLHHSFRDEVVDHGRICRARSRPWSALKRLARSSAMAPIVRGPVDELQHGDSLVVDVEGAFGGEQHVRVSHLVEMQAHAAREASGTLVPVTSPKAEHPPSSLMVRKRRPCRSHRTTRLPSRRYASPCWNKPPPPPVRDARRAPHASRRRIGGRLIMHVVRNFMFR